MVVAKHIKLPTIAYESWRNCLKCQEDGNCFSCGAVFMLTVVCIGNIYAENGDISNILDS